MIYNTNSKNLNEWMYNPSQKYNKRGIKMSEGKKNQPKRKIGIGLVQVTEWERDGKNGKFSNFSIGMSYFDEKDKKYKDASSVSRPQLYDLKTCIDIILQKGSRQVENETIED